MRKISLLVNKQYKDGQTDGMKLYKEDDDRDTKYVFATNAKDAKLKFKANLTVPYNQVKEYLRHMY